MPFQNACSMKDSPLPSGWLGRIFKIHRKCTSCFSVRCGDASVSECQDDTLPPQLQLTHQYDTEQNESELDTQMLLPSSSMTSHSCKQPVSVSRGHLAPYCLWMQNKNSMAECRGHGKLWAQTPNQTAKFWVHILPRVGPWVSYFSFLPLFPHLWNRYSDCTCLVNYQMEVPKNSVEVQKKHYVNMNSP